MLNVDDQKIVSKFEIGFYLNLNLTQYLIHFNLTSTYR